MFLSRLQSHSNSVQFLEDIRHVMGIPEWMLSVDSRKITLLHNGACVQMLIHFKGPLAHKMEQDLSRLIAGARLDSPTLNIVGYAMPKRRKMLAYRVCGVREPNEKNGNEEIIDLLIFEWFLFSMKIFL